MMSIGSRELPKAIAAGEVIWVFGVELGVVGSLVKRYLNIDGCDGGYLKGEAPCIGLQPNTMEYEEFGRQETKLHAIFGEKGCESGDCARVGLNESKADGCGKRMVVSDSYKNTSTITAEKKPRGKKAMAPYERTPQYPCSNLILVESSFGTLVKTSMDGPAGLVFGPAGVALGPAELAQKTPN
ncbi:hypothetical protein Tco_0865657 [Tanacetum coccineum]